MTRPSGFRPASWSYPATYQKFRRNMAVPSVHSHAFNTGFHASSTRNFSLVCLPVRVRKSSAQIEQTERDRGNVADQHERGEIDQHEWNDAAIDRAQRLVEDCLRCEQVEAERRRVHADAEIDRHDDAE